MLFFTLPAVMLTCNAPFIPSDQKLSASLFLDPRSTPVSPAPETVPCGTLLLAATYLPVLDESAHLYPLKATQPQLPFYSEMLVGSVFNIPQKKQAIFSPEPLTSHGFLKLAGQVI